MHVLTEGNEGDEIAVLNTIIDAHIREYLARMRIELSWDAPDPDNPPTSPIIHLFLYLIHEDLELRHGKAPRYLPESKRFEPRSANVSCLYLVTYWEQDGGGDRGGGSPGSAPDSQAVIVLNRVTKALLSLRTHPDLQHCSVRVIEPEALNSLGNFWQSLGDKPKTIINFAVTLPISFEKPTDEVVPIASSSEVQLGQGSESWEILLERYLLDELREALRDSSVPVSAMNKVVLQVTPILDESSTSLQAKIRVTGVASASVEAFLGPLIAAWRGATVTPGKESITIQEVRNTIIPISMPGSDSWQAQLKHYLLKDLREALEGSEVEVPVNALDGVELLVTQMPGVTPVAKKNSSKQAKIQVTGVAFVSVIELLTGRINDWEGDEVGLDNESIVMQKVENTIVGIREPREPVRR